MLIGCYLDAEVAHRIAIRELGAKVARRTVLTNDVEEVAVRFLVLHICLYLFEVLYTAHFVVEEA